MLAQDAMFASGLEEIHQEMKGEDSRQLGSDHFKIHYLLIKMSSC